MGKHSATKRAAKDKQKAINTLQNQVADEIKEVFIKENRTLDLAEIVENYLDNDRKKENDTQTLKQYVMMGLGLMIQDGRVKQLDVDTDGKHKLELVQ